MNFGLLICFCILCFHALLCISTFIPEGGSPHLLKGEQLDNGSNEMIGREEEDGKNEVKHVGGAKGGKGTHGGGSNVNRRHPNKDKNGAASFLAQSFLISLQLQVNIVFVLAFLFFF